MPALKAPIQNALKRVGLYHRIQASFFYDLYWGVADRSLVDNRRKETDFYRSLLAGFGGVQAEILHDVRLMPADLTLDGFAHELQLLKSAPLLRGFRGAAALDVAAVADIISRVAALLRGEPSIREIDLNPVIVYADGQGAIALDALLVLA